MVDMVAARSAVKPCLALTARRRVTTFPEVVRHRLGLDLRAIEPGPGGLSIGKPIGHACPVACLASAKIGVYWPQRSRRCSGSPPARRPGPTPGPCRSSGKVIILSSAKPIAPSSGEPIAMGSPMAITLSSRKPIAPGSGKPIILLVQPGGRAGEPRNQRHGPTQGDGAP